MRFTFLPSLLGLVTLAGIATAQEDRAAKTLAVWDTNGDGVLTADEFPDQATFLKADRDGNGKVTRDEVAIFLGLQPPPAEPEGTDKGKDAPNPEPKDKPKDKPKEPGATKTDGGMAKAPRTIPERVADFFQRFDADKNEKVEKKEAAGIGPDMWIRFDRNRDDAFSIKEATRYIRFTLTEAKKRPTPANFFDLFDRNRDERVTSKEYDGPSAFFKQYDHDKNRVVTLEELNMGPDAGKTSTRQMEADKAFMGDGPTIAPRMGLLERYDKDEDGRITLEELNGAEALMTRLDQNGDGVLSGSEAK